LNDKPVPRLIKLMTAAELSGYSLRQFRRIVDEEPLRVVQINQTYFLLGTEFAEWQKTNERKPAENAVAVVEFEPQGETT
jgi:hypothetical protein